MSKLNFCRPTTPATTGLIWIPTRASQLAGNRCADSRVATAHSTQAITGSSLQERPVVATTGIANGLDLLEAVPPSGLRRRTQADADPLTISSGACALQNAVKPTMSANRTATFSCRRGVTPGNCARPLPTPEGWRAAIPRAPPLPVDLREVSHRTSCSRFLSAAPLPASRSTGSNGFCRKVLRAARDAADHAVHVCQSRDHDHRNMPPCRMRPHALEHAISIEPGHHDVEKDNVERSDLEPLGFLAVCGPDACASQKLEFLLEDIEIEGLAVDDDMQAGSTGPSSRGPAGKVSLPFMRISVEPPVQCCQQQVLVDRFRQEVIAARRLRLPHRRSSRGP